MPRDGTIEVAGTLTGELSKQETISGELQKVGEISGELSLPTERIVPGDYPPLRDKPQINGEVLIGNKSFEDLGDHIMTNLEIKTMFDKIFKGGN